MLTQAENDVLTRTNTDQSMGQYFRRFWQPVALSRELAEADGAPMKVTVMGEELVLFRAADARMRDEVRIKAYPTREFGDLVWAYMGPQDEPIPEVPQLEFGLVPAEHRYVSKRLNECNWAQTMEGGLDTSHFSFLHMPAPKVPSNENPDAPADARRLRWIRNDPMPQFSLLEHEVGFVIGGARDADEDETYWRITQYLLPAHGTGPSTLPGETYFGYTLVPIDDHTHWIYTYGWNPERPIGAEEREKLELGHGIMAQVDQNFQGLRNRSNDYQIDRQAQSEQTFTGIRGLAEQDAMIQESQGRVADRTREHLTATDAGVVRFRRTVLDGAAQVAAGQTLAAPRHHQLFHSRPGSWIANAGTAFEDVMRERFGDRLGRLNNS